jgi:flagellin
MSTLSIANNVASLSAQNNLTKANGMLGRSLERLSSGLKVNRGADGPAALVISEQQRAQISGLRTALDNTGKAISVVQTGEGALNEMARLLNKVRSLAVDSANTGVNDSSALAANQSEIDNILGNIDRIATQTQFGTRKLLDGTAGVNAAAGNAAVSVNRATVDTQAGDYAVNVTTAAEKANLSAGTGQTAALAQGETLTVNKVQISLSQGMSQQQVVDRINEFSSQTGVVADIDAGNTRLLSKEFGSAASVEVVSNVAAATDSSGFGIVTARDTGVDIAGTIDTIAARGIGNNLTATNGDAKGLSVSIAVGTANAFTSETGALGDVAVADNSLSFQICANSGQSVNVAFDKVTTAALGTNASNSFTSLSKIDVSNGSEAIKVIDAAISDVSNLRGRLGAFQSNTLESNANNLRTSLENTTAAESVVRDTDFAQEIANFTKMQVQLQAGTTVLGNANQTTQLIAGLLRG